MTDTTATHRNAGTSRTPGSRLFASVPVLFLVPASLGIFLIAGPLLGLFLNIPSVSYTHLTLPTSDLV